MSLTRAIVLQSPIYDNARLGALVERCLADGVDLIAITGRNSHKLEAEVDWMIIGDGSRPERFICTSAHPSHDDEDGIGDALCLAASYGRETEDGFDQVLIFGGTMLRYRSKLDTSRDGA